MSRPRKHKKRRYLRYDGSYTTIHIYGIASEAIERITWGEIRKGQPFSEAMEGSDALSKVQFLRYPHLEKPKPCP